MLIFARLAVIAQHAHLARGFPVVGGDGASLAASAEVFPRVEAEGGGAAHATGREPGADGARQVLRSVRLASVLNHEEAMALGQFQNRVHVRGLAI